MGQSTAVKSISDKGETVFTTWRVQFYDPARRTRSFPSEAEAVAFAAEQPEAVRITKEQTTIVWLHPDWVTQPPMQTL